MGGVLCQPLLAQRPFQDGLQQPRRGVDGAGLGGHLAVGGAEAGHVGVPVQQQAGKVPPRRRENVLNVEAKTDW